MTNSFYSKNRSSIRKKRPFESSEKRKNKFVAKMGAKVAVCEHQSTSTTMPCNPTQAEPRRFERFRKSLDYWRSSFLGGCNFIG
jgi:hypothetical protein